VLDRDDATLFRRTSPVHELPRQRGHTVRRAPRVSQGRCLGLLRLVDTRRRSHTAFGQNSVKLPFIIAETKVSRGTKRESSEKLLNCKESSVSQQVHRFLAHKRRADLGPRESAYCGVAEIAGAGHSGKSTCRDRHVSRRSLKASSGHGMRTSCCGVSPR